jgi:hypothetical protein
MLKNNECKVIETVILLELKCVNIMSIIIFPPVNKIMIYCI